MIQTFSPTYRQLMALSINQSINQSMGALVQEVERQSTNWKIGGLISGSSSPHVDVSFGKTLNPNTKNPSPVAMPTV